jgi:S-(hydroxymethyl)glutathione dehydrogenase/alcohol dehydrogenase
LCCMCMLPPTIIMHSKLLISLSHVACLASASAFASHMILSYLILRYVVLVFGLGGVGLACILGAKLNGAKHIYAVDINADKWPLAKKFGATEFINPKDYEKENKTIQQVLVEKSPTGWGIDYTFECVGNVKLMRSALEAAHRGWGKSIVIGVAGAGQEICTRPFQLVTGRQWLGSAFGGVKGRTELPGLVEESMKNIIPLDDFITGHVGLAKINEAFEMLHGKQSTCTCSCTLY